MKNYIIRGQRVLLNLPEIKKSTIEVDEKLQRQLMEKEMKKWSNLTVLAVGDEVLGIEPGNGVYVNPIFLQNAERVEIDGVEKLIVRQSDISIVWF